jgi:hypothetical protein
MGIAFKEIVGCRAEPGESVAAFHVRLLGAAADIRHDALGLTRLVVNLAERSDTAAVPGSFDAIVELWGNGLASVSPPGQQGRWLVEEIVEKDQLPCRQGQITPGPRSMPFITFDPALDLAGRRERWARHAALGLRIHTGLARYVRNVVLETLLPTETDVHAIAGLSFASDEDLRDGLFPTQEARAEFLADIQGFVTGNIGHRTREHVMLWPSSQESDS